jgi:hypothetical protein
MRVDNTIVLWSMPVGQFCAIYKGAEHSSRLLKVKTMDENQKKVFSVIGL